MESKIYKLAKKNYPDPWNKECLKRLVEHEPQRLTPEEYEEITGEPYEENAD